MEQAFNFEKYSCHDLYHLRYGRGAVIVAIPRLGDEPFFSDHGRVGSDKSVARIFHELIGNRTKGTAPLFSKVLSISENGEFVSVTIKFEQKQIFAPVVCHPVDAVIERVIPAKSVSFEVVKENNSVRP